MSALGRLSGNTPGRQATRRRRAKYSIPAVQPIGPSGETVAARSGQGKISAPAAVGHEQAEDDPAEPVGPAQDRLEVLAKAEDRGHDQRGEDADLDEAVEPDGLEVRHALETR